MKWIISYLTVFVSCLMSFGGLISSNSSPEQLIEGTWIETSWEYEKINERDGDQSLESIEKESLRNTIKKNLIIHEAEAWTFKKNGELILIGKNIRKTVTWRIKGRGNILQLKYDNSVVENFNLTELGDEKMYLNFETDIQARGIAKLTFEKVKD